MSCAPFLRIIVIVLMAALGGCQTGAQRLSDRNEQIYVAANAARGACMAPILAEPSYTPIRRRVSRPTSPVARPALERIGDPDKISDAELPLTIRRFDELSRCQDAWITALAQISPGRAASQRQSAAETSALYLRLVRREITWGELNQAIDNIELQAAERWRKIVTEERQYIQRQHNAELGQRQAAAAAFGDSMQRQQDAMQRQQIINAINRPVINQPVITNCYRTGNTMNCTSN